MFKTLQSALFVSFVGILLLCLFVMALLATPQIKTATMIAALIIAVIAAILVSMLFARSFFQPITRLVEISRQIADGEFPQFILHKSKFEVGKLEEAVEQMSQRLSDSFGRLKQERGQAQAILSSMAEGVLAVDKNCRIMSANPAIEKTFGVIEPEILGHSVREGLRNNPIADLVDEALKPNQDIEREISTVLPTEGIFVAHAGPIRVEGGEVLGVICVLHNITEIRKLEKYRSEFVANVSHELKTPLTSIRNYVETLIGGAIEDKENNLKFLGKIDKHAVNLSSLIDDILAISQLEARKELGTFVRFDLSRTISRAVESISEKARKKGIRLDSKCGGEELFISGIEEHVYRAVLNLLDNAVNYTNQGGEVAVSAKKDSEKIVVSVSDTGIGIPAEHLPRIFERFYRVDKARSRELGGTGLGLAIVKHVMNLQKGSVSVESEEGNGTKFTLVFPA